MFLQGCGGVTNLSYSRPIIQGIPAEGLIAPIKYESDDVYVYAYTTNTKLLRGYDEFLFIPIYFYPDNNYFNSGYYDDTKRSNYDPKYFVIEILIVTRHKNVFFQPTNVCLQLPRLRESCIYPIEWLPSLSGLSKSEFDENEKKYRRAPYVHPQGNLCINPFVLRKAKSVNDETKGIRGYGSGFTSISTNSLITVQSGSAYCVALKFPTAPPDPKMKEEFKLLLGSIRVDSKELPLPEIKYIPETGTFGSGH